MQFKYTVSPSNVALKGCPRCKRDLPLDHFGAEYYCRECCRSYRAERASQPRKCSRCKECLPPSAFTSTTSYCKPCYSQWASENPDKTYKRDASSNRRHWLKQVYGMTVEGYDDMLEAQGHACAICGKPESAGQSRLRIDHCHDSGEVRGLLCNNCNLGIGHFKDDPERLASAIRYLENSSKTPSPN